MKLNKRDTILFIGDSITDVGRNREESKDLGKGYPLMVAAYLLERYPELNLSFLNRGISGNKITDLANRWKEDCLALKPDVISILIGINDVWDNMETKEWSIEESVDKFEFYYRILLETVKEQTKAQIVLIEPFVLKSPEEQEAWEIELEPRKKIIRKLANEYDADYIELDNKLNEFGKSWGNDYVSEDGVHPKPAGHAVITKTWLQYVENEK